MTEIPPAKVQSHSWRLPLVVIMAGMMALFTYGLTRDPTLLPSALVGQPLPQFELASLNQSGVIKSEDFAGKPLVLNFWASWCTSCLIEHDDLMRLGLLSAATGEFNMVGVNSRDNAKNALQFLAKYGEFPYASGVDLDGRTGIDFGVYGMPETFFVDASGVIRIRHAGPLNPKIIARSLKEIGVTP